MTTLNYPQYGHRRWKAPVATTAALPAVANVEGDCRVVLDTQKIYIWDGSAWANITGSITLDDILDVVITSPAENQALEFDGTNWVNRTPIIAQATHEPNGFENRTDSVLAFDSGTREFSITAAVTDWKIWTGGERQTLTGPLTSVIPAATGTTFLYIDSAGSLQQSSSVPNMFTSAWASSIYWNNTTGDYLFSEERHGIVMDGATHAYLHLTRGAAYASGGDITRTLSNTTLAGNQIALTETLYYDEDIPHTLAAWVAGTTWQKWYIDASGNWLRLATDNNLLGSNVTVPNFFTADPVLGYNNTTAGTIDAVSLTQYVNVYVLGTNDKRSEYRFIVLCGQADHANTSSAYAETIDSLSFGNLPIPELKPLYQLTYQRVNTGIGCQIVRALDIRKTRALGVPSTAASTHNALSGLQGGTAGEYYHLTSADYANVVAVVNSSGIDLAGTLNVGATNATEVNVGNVANTVTTNIYGDTVNIGEPGGTVNLLGAVNNINATDVFVPNDLEVDGVIYADGGIDATAATLNIGATSQTQTNIGRAGVDNYLIGTTRVTGDFIISSPNTFTATGPITIGATAAISVGSGATITGTLTSSTLAVTGAVTWNTAQSFPGITLTGNSNFGSVTIAGTPTWSGAHTFQAGQTVTGLIDQDVASGVSVYNQLWRENRTANHAFIGIRNDAAGKWRITSDVAGSGTQRTIQIGDAAEAWAEFGDAITLSKPVTIGPASHASPVVHTMYGNSFDISSRGYSAATDVQVAVELFPKGNARGLFLTQIQTDSGTSPVIELDGRLAAAAVVTRPLFRLSNYGSSRFEVSAAGAVALGPSGFGGDHQVYGGRFKVTNGGGVAEIEINSNSTNVARLLLNRASTGDSEIYAGAGFTFATGLATSVVTAGTISSTGAWTLGPTTNTQVHDIRSPAQTTVGAAGGASALPATPTGYVEVKIQGTAYVIPYYAKS